MVSSRFAELKAHDAHLEPMLRGLGGAHAARVARIAAGAVGIAGTVVMVGIVALGGPRWMGTYALLGSCLAVVATYVGTFSALSIGAAFGSPAGGARGLPNMRPESLEGLAQLEARNPLHVMDRKLSRLETWSSALPLAAASLLTPLALHFVFGALVFGPQTTESFGGWIQCSVVIVGHAHLVLVGLSIRYARKMRRLSMQELDAMKVGREWGKAWGFTVLASCVPGIVLLGVPPAISALTSILFVPLMFIGIRRVILRERLALAVAYASADDARGSRRAPFDELV